MEIFKVSILIFVGIAALVDVEAGGSCGRDPCVRDTCGSRETCCGGPCDKPIYSNSSAHQTKPVANSIKSNIATSCKYDDRSGCFYYVDVNGTQYQFVRYCPDCGKANGANVVYPNGTKVDMVNFIERTVKSDVFAVGTGREVWLCRWNGVSEQAVLFDIIWTSANATRVLSAAMADRAGNLLFTDRELLTCFDPLTPYDGQLWSIGLNSSGQYESKVLINSESNKIKVGNGMCLSPCGKKLYTAESCISKITEYSYDQMTGTISEGSARIVYNNTGGGLIADLTCTIDGTIFAAIFMESCVKEVDPGTGTVLNIIPMDSPIPGSNCLGGQQRNKLYTVTGTIDPLIPGQGLAYETNCIGTSGVRTGLFALGSDQI